MAIWRTERQLEVLQFIVSYIDKNGQAPTIREIGEHVGAKSPSGVICHLDALERKGFIRRNPGGPRGLTIVDAACDPDNAPELELGVDHPARMALRSFKPPTSVRKPATVNTIAADPRAFGVLFYADSFGNGLQFETPLTTIPDKPKPPATLRNTDLLTTQEAGEYLGISVGTMQGWRVTGMGPKFVKIGKGRTGRVRYRKSLLDEWLKLSERTHTY